VVRNAIEAKPDRVKKLARAVSYHRDVLDSFRKTNQMFLGTYVGRYYGDRNRRGVKRTPLNLFKLAASIYQQHLFPGVPRIHISTSVRGLKAVASNRELVLNMLLDEIDFGSTMKMCGLDAILMCGIVRTGLMRLGEVDIGGETMDPGQPYCRRVSLNDWVHDTCAQQYDEVQIAGNRWSAPLEWAKDFKGFNRKAREDLTAYTSMPDEDKDVDPHDISRGESIYEENYREIVKFWDIWCPMDNTVHTLPCGIGGDPIDKELRVVDFDGPEGGPYDILGFGDTPDHVIPVSPASNLYDLNDMLNETLRKCARQATNSKRGMAFRSSQKRDAKAHAEFNDGEAFFVDDPTTGKPVVTGGIDQLNLAFFLQLIDKFTYAAGNLNTLGGLGTGAETLGQEQLLFQQSSGMVQDMEARSRKFQLSAAQKLAFYLFADPLIKRNSVKRIGNLDRWIPVTIEPEDLEADYEHNFDFSLSSASNQGPAAKLAAMNSAWNTYAMPLMQAGIMQAQKIAPDVRYIFDTLSELTGVPEIAEMYGINLMKQQVGDLPSHQRQYMASTLPSSNGKTKPRAGGNDDLMARLMTMPRGGESSNGY
jgi:hypothetical protein